jgi:hypothetical protein
MTHSLYGSFATNGGNIQQNEIEDMGPLARSVQYNNVDTRMSAMMMKASSSSPFGETHVVNHKEGALDRNERLQALVTEGVLRPSDVFLKSRRNAFLAKLLPGTFSYYQRVRENSFLFQEYQSCSNDSEQQRIIQEIVESVWLNEGRFLVIDKNTNSVVVVDDQQLSTMIFQDLISRENTIPALSSNDSSTGIKNKTKTNNKKNNHKRKLTVAKTKKYNPLSNKALSSGRNGRRSFKSSQTRHSTAAFGQNLAENAHSQNCNNTSSAVGQRGWNANGSQLPRSGRATSSRYTYRNKKSGDKTISYPLVPVATVATTPS